ncbi:MAG: type II/IV secretion system ATPase subunit [Candidatus Aenigmarchaeota archaeon]|nr:type II/IV secretion system ATPase subunit [Candidatus Aenigmarchaeota archaeon]
MVFETEYADGILKINCLDSIFGFTLEDSEYLMSFSLDKILEFKRVERIILAERREYEYDFDQTAMIVEIANLYDKIVNKDRILEDPSLFHPTFNQFISQPLQVLQFIVTDLLKKDPIGAFVKIKRMTRLYELKLEKSLNKNERIALKLLLSKLKTIKSMLQETRLIKNSSNIIFGHKIGDRNPYRIIFNPMIRPIFMLTRYTSLPPKNSRLVDRYILPGNIQVEIFKVPDKVRLYYFLNAPEFRLDDEKYAILENARRQLAEHKPSETEFTNPDKVREIFTNIGRDLILQCGGKKFSSKEIEELTNILVRHTTGFGVLELILNDEKLQDIYINSPVGVTPIYVHHDDYDECETNLIPTREDAESWATRFRLFSGRPLDEANPVLDTELFVPGGRARVAAITRNLSPDGIAYALRRHRDKPWTYPLLLNQKYFSPLYAGLMSFIVDGSRSILFAGGRSSGKSSMLGATMIEIMKKFRIITVEDTLELPVPQLRNLGYNIERMKSRSVITRVESELPAEEALRTALRLGDSCLIVGEVRSKEAIALFEAMRIGALAHVVAGTIHGESAYGVFDRVVNDLGVTKTSFKAIDIVTISGMIKSADGLRRFRRVLEVTEIRKHWKDDPMEENGFVNLMEYSAKEDMLKPTDTLLNGESYVINEIAKRVREWHGNWEAVWENIELRAKIKKTMVDYAVKLNRKDILEAEWVSASNEMFHLISDQVQRELGGLDSKEIFTRWNKWFKQSLRGAI